MNLNVEASVSPNINIVKFSLCKIIPGAPASTIPPRALPTSAKRVLVCSSRELSDAPLPHLHLHTYGYAYRRGEVQS